MRPYRSDDARHFYPRARGTRGKRTMYGTRPLGDGPVIRPSVPVESIGSEPRDRFAHTLPLRPNHEAVLLQLQAGKTTSASQIAKAVGRSPAAVVSSLYALADRGLVERVPYKGWKLVEDRD